MEIGKRHRGRPRPLPVLIAAFLSVFQNSVANAQAPRPTAKTIRVLFIGNSLTYVNDLPAELQAMVAAGYPGDRPFHYESVTPGGCTLKKHWNDGKAPAKIAEGGWDFVVLQEQSQIPFSDRAQMYHYARLFDREIKKVGAKTVLYMTFPLKKKFVDGDDLPEIYDTLGKELGAIVVPVDVAWHEAAKRDPALVLYKADGVHPAPAGTYLAACCFAKKLWGKAARPYPAKLIRAKSKGKLLVDLDKRQAGELQHAAAAVVSAAVVSVAVTALAAESANRVGGDAAKPTRSDGPWIDLFNGKDLSGWNDPQSLWKVEDGILVGGGGKGYLDTRRADFANFQLRLEAMINDGGNSGVVFRAHRGGSYEAQIEANGADHAKTGSLYVYNGKGFAAKVGLKESPAPANKWFTMEVIAEGFHLTIRIDGNTVAHVDEDDHISSVGRIRLQVSNAQTLVKFRNIRIREFKRQEE